MLSIIDIIEDTTVDGPGFRTAIYAAGCPNQCPGCHNPESWDINKGRPVPTEEILERIKEETRQNIWCYTGYKFEKLLENPKQAALLQYVDVLVDGKFKQALHDESLLFRGSSNQRLIDVKKSLKENKVVFYNYNPFI